MAPDSAGSGESQLRLSRISVAPTCAGRYARSQTGAAHGSLAATACASNLYRASWDRSGSPGVLSMIFWLRRGSLSC
jgi:hypothetical protein